MLSGLIRQFEDLCDDLVLAVRHGDEIAVNRIDKALQPIIRRIFSLYARNRIEANLQLVFFAKLAVRNCEDDASVRRYTEIMTTLFNRYLDLGAGLPRSELETPETRLRVGYDASLHEMVLDSIPERVAVIGLDYRYIYTNERNASFHQMRPSEFIGRHLVDLIGHDRFANRAKPRLDQCFGGAKVSYNYELPDAAGRLFEINCRMTPFVGAGKKIIGSVLVLGMQPTFARID